ncbi:hypothetical protein FRC08_017797 [Ceratobasidium sp. 394]|nr:hypothetical protein FRC08_017797 [Ceratobasidium sp. 394]
MDFTTESLVYPSYDGEDLDSYYSALASGAPAFPSLAPPGLPQESSTGRMDPEFLGDDPMQGDTDEDKQFTVARGLATRILGFSPREGQPGTTITVQLVFAQGPIVPKTKIAFRIKMGSTPLMTSISGVVPAKGVGGYWQLQVVAPDPIELDVVGLEVPLIVQAFDVRIEEIVDDVCIGSFKFIPLGNRRIDGCLYLWGADLEWRLRSV